MQPKEQSLCKNFKHLTSEPQQYSDVMKQLFALFLSLVLEKFRVLIKGLYIL